MKVLAVEAFITNRYPVAVQRVARRATTPKISPVNLVTTKSRIPTPTPREEIAEISRPVLRDSSRIEASNFKRVEAFLTKALSSGLSSQALAKAILRNFDKDKPLHPELSQGAVVGALGSIATHAATANLPGLLMSAFEVLTQLAETNHPMAEMAAQQLYSLRRNGMWFNARAMADLGIKNTAASVKPGNDEIALAA